MEKRNYVRDDKGLKDDARDKYGVGEVGELVHGLSWPPRSYNCTFCKREFRSAQALGGHMNVHRRDRAMLRQVSSSQNFSSTLFKLNLLHPNHNSNPSCNPNFPSHVSSNLSSTTTMLSPSFPSIGNASYRLCDEGVENLAMKNSHVPGFEFCKFLGFPCENENMIARNSEIVRWDSEISLLGESKSDDLDLELRLGCS